jgi:phage terminase large subunit-like protein
MTLKLSDTKILQYAEDVLSGKQLASQKVIAACRRFVHDLEMEGHREYPWRFDLNKALRPIEFIEKFLKPTKGDYDKMEFMPWQHFVEGNVYGWVSKETGLRRFREALMIVGRGNGKSTKIAGNSTFMASKDGEPGADIFLMANSRDQVNKTVFTPCKEQINASPLLSKHFRVLRNAIHYDRANATIEPLASDSKLRDGLTPHGMIFDEVHAFRDYKLINVMKRAMKKRRQPLIWYISTMGDVLDGPLMDFYLFAGDIINEAVPVHVADRFFFYIAELDENDRPEDTATWIKANPALGAFLSYEETLLDWETSQRSPRERADFINKQLNIFTDTGDMPYVDVEIVKRNKEKIDIATLKGLTCYGGFDASLREDFTAADLEFPLPDGRFFELHHSWVTQRKVDLDNEKLDYRGFQERGLLTIVPGEYIKLEYMLEWYLAMNKLYDIRSIGYDPANAGWLIQSLVANGIECNAVIQGWKTLNDPMKDIKELLIDGRIVTNDDPMLWWYLYNVKLRKLQGDVDHENWVPTKRGKYRKIDGFMAWLDAHAENMRKNPVLPEVREPSIEVYKLF